MNAQQTALYLQLQHQEITTELDDARAKRDGAANPKAAIMFSNMVEYLERQLADTQAQIDALGVEVETVEAADEALVEAIIEDAHNGMVIVPGLKAVALRRVLTAHFGAPAQGARSTGPGVRTTYHALKLPDGGSLRITYTPQGATALVY
jgi:hypothetical protein